MRVDGDESVQDPVTSREAKQPDQFCVLLDHAQDVAVQKDGVDELVAQLLARKQSKGKDLTTLKT
jgi:hypothetical protein